MIQDSDSDRKCKQVVVNDLLEDILSPRISEILAWPILEKLECDNADISIAFASHILILVGS